MAFDQAAVELEQRAETRARVQSALAYPAVLLAVGAISVGAIVLIVVPRFATLLSDVQTTLPASTRSLLAFSTVVRRHGVILLTAATGLVVAGGLWVTSRRSQWHDFLLSTPVIGPFRHALASIRGARALAALLDRGAPALVALSAARSAVGDEAVARRLAAAGERVTQGASLSQALVADAAFTPLTLQLATIGDGVGRIPDLLRRAADIEERLAEQRLRTFIALLEPSLVVLFAVAVALVAAALLQAVYAVRPGAL